MKDLNKRLTLSFFAIPFVVCLLVFSGNSWFQYFVTLLLALITCVAVWEYEQFVKAKGGRLFLPVLLAFTLLEVLSFFAAAKFSGFTGAPLAVFFVAFVSLFALHFKEKEGAIVDLAVSSFGLTYVVLPMGMVLGILYFPGGQDGRWWVAYLLLVTKITDIGAYFAGNLWGRRKLAPSISPGKTVEGTLFGLICAVVVSFGFHLLSRSFSMDSFRLSSIESLVFGFVLGLLGPLGDLSESLLKRDANKKDSNALPGFGGVLDMVDSILFNAPVIYLYLYFVKL
jgi:phosphatidate cytidylyltransferase